MAHMLPSWLSWYKKPSYVDLKAFASVLNKRAEEKYEERASPRNSFSSLRSEESIPKDLTLERVLANKTCSPMSLYDFYMYLKHIEYSQENLEFYIWFKDYRKRYTYTDQSIQSPQYDEKEPTVEVISVAPSSKSGSLGEDKIPSEKPFTRTESQISPEFSSYIETLVLHEAARYPKPCYTTFLSSNDPQHTDKDTLHHQRREELENIAALFLQPGSSKELNIPGILRKSTLANLTTSDSPDHLIKIAEHIYQLLKYGSHRNFVRLGVNNGTFETLCMVTFVGITMTVVGLLAMLTLAFASPSIHNSPCWRGLATIPFWFIGISFLLAGMRGSCFLLLLFSRRQQLPWERMAENDRLSVEITHDHHHHHRNNNVITSFTRKLMLFERKIRVRDMGLRRLQRKIVLQSIAGAVICTALLEVFFLCLPIWK